MQESNYMQEVARGAGKDSTSDGSQEQCLLAGSETICRVGRWSKQACTTVVRGSGRTCGTSENGHADQISL
jgi:hypothetical protein